ncbi:hypothetical protein FPV67DRAFT_1415542, partial [Lyophyllum atratum]
YFFTQIPQPMQRNSEMNAILSVGLTSIHNFPRESLYGYSAIQNPLEDTHPFLRQDMTAMHRSEPGRCLLHVI